MIEEKASLLATLTNLKK